MSERFERWKQYKDEIDELEQRLIVDFNFPLLESKQEEYNVLCDRARDVNAWIWALEDEFDYSDTLLYEAWWDSVIEYNHQKYLIASTYGTDDPASIADFWQRIGQVA